MGGGAAREEYDGRGTVELSIQSLTGEHRQIETSLDSFAESIGLGTISLNAFRCLHELCARHYEHEAVLLVQLGSRDAALATKLQGQHDEVLEIASHLIEAEMRGQTADTMYLARRFLAMARHNIIEEERDVFPLVTESE
jgi:hypothetical protein